MRMCIIICQSQRDKGTGEPDEAISFMSGSEGGWGKRPAMDLARSLPSGCTIPATLRPWLSVVRRWASRRWRPQQPWTGRPCVPNGATRIRNGVPPAVSGSCVPASSRVAVRHRLHGLGNARHKADTRHAAGRSRSGGWCVWRWPGGASPQAGQWSGGLRGPSLRTTAPQERRSGLVGGGRARG